MKKERAENAYQHAKKMLEMYQSIPIQSGWFGSTLIVDKIRRYEEGERSEKLIKEMEEII